MLDVVPAVLRSLALFALGPKSGGRAGGNDDDDDLRWLAAFRGLLAFLARATPSWRPGEFAAYHAVAYSWILGGLVEAAYPTPEPAPGGEGGGCGPGLPLFSLFFCSFVLALFLFSLCFSFFFFFFFFFGGCEGAVAREGAPCGLRARALLPLSLAAPRPCLPRKAARRPGSSATAAAQLCGGGGSARWGA